MQDHESHLVRAAATRTIQVTPQSAPAIVRRAFDKHPDVRVASFEVISDMMAAKIVKVQLRSHLLMTGLNDQNGKHQVLFFIITTNYNTAVITSLLSRSVGTSCCGHLFASLAERLQQRLCGFSERRRCGTREALVR